MKAKMARDKGQKAGARKQSAQSGIDWAPIKGWRIWSAKRIIVEKVTGGMRCG